MNVFSGNIEYMYNYILGNRIEVVKCLKKNLRTGYSYTTFKNNGMFIYLIIDVLDNKKQFEDEVVLYVDNKDNYMITHKNNKVINKIITDIKIITRNNKIDKIITKCEK